MTIATTTPDNAVRRGRGGSKSDRSLSSVDRAVIIRQLATERLGRAGIDDLHKIMSSSSSKKKKSESTPGSVTAVTEIDDPDEAFRLGSMVGHGQFHAVYNIETITQRSGFPFKVRKSPDRVVLKTLRVQMSSSASSSPEKIATGAADLVKEGMILAALSNDTGVGSNSVGTINAVSGGHPNIIRLRGWTPGGLDAFFKSPSGGSGGGKVFKFDAFCLVLDKLDSTLKDVLAHEWKQEQEWFHERLGDEVATDDDEDDDDSDSDDDELDDDRIDSESSGTSSPSSSKKNRNKDGNSLHANSTHSHNNNPSTLSCVLSPFSFWKNLSRRSPEATKALLDRRHQFLLRRLYACLELADALQFLHSRRILHRDLKPANVGMQHRGNAERLVVFDMDLSRVMPSSSSGDTDDNDDPNESTYHMTSMVGSRQYMAPEIAVSNTPYNLKADVYTFGLLVWEMLNIRSNPFGEYLMNDDEDGEEKDEKTNHHTMTESQVDRAVIRDGLRPTIPRNVWCQSLCDVVSASWSPDISDRPTMAENYLSLQVIYGKLKAQGEMISAAKEEQAIRRQQREQRRKERRIQRNQLAAISTIKTESDGADKGGPIEKSSNKTEDESSSSSISSTNLSVKQHGVATVSTATIKGSSVGRTTEVMAV